jgi:hypothetical protein
MVTYTVHEPPNPPADRVDRAESLVFVKDGFSWLAALFAPLWMLAHQLWWPLLGYLVLSVVLQVIGWLAGASPDTSMLAGMALNALVGFEAGTLRAWTLQRRQWQNLGAVTGRTLEECERRFLEAWLPSQPIIAPATGSSRLGGLLAARG